MANFTPQQIEQFLQDFFDVVGARQYIGARYVPIFGRAGEDTVEWDDLAPYEPLTVVMHLGVSYVSRRYVPQGIQITNTEYWVQTYRFNAQVEQYRQEVLSFQGQIDQVREDMESDYVPFPDSGTYPKYGTLGQVLTTLSNGETKWENPVVPSDAQAEEVITAWLTAHPEATTTVQDGAITEAKLANALKNVLVYTKTAPSDDCNALTTNGVFSVNTTFANVPAGMTQNGVMLVAAYGDQRIGQLLFEYGVSRFWYRSYPWHGWLKIEQPEPFDPSDIYAEFKSVYSYISTGRNDYETLELGAYVGNMTWSGTSPHNQASVHSLIPYRGQVLHAKCSLSGTHAVIKEFAYRNGSWTNTGNGPQGNDVSYACKPDMMYNVCLYNGHDAFTEPPTSGFEFYETSPFFDSLLTKDSSKINYSYNSSTETLTIETPFFRYIVKHQVDASINLNTWRLYAGYTKVNGNWSKMWENSDGEGPIRIDNESDFIGGFHGDEIMSAVTISIDDGDLDLTSDASGVCDSVTLYQTSTVYHADSNVQAFTRYKRDRFVGSEFNVQQRWVALDSCVVTVGALCLLSCLKTVNDGWDTDCLIPMQTLDTAEVQTMLDPSTRRGNFYLKNGKTISLVAEVGADNEYYSPDIQNASSQNRNKFYFHMYNGKTLAIGDELISKFSVEVDSLQ